MPLSRPSTWDAFNIWYVYYPDLDKRRLLNVPEISVFLATEPPGFHGHINENTLGAHQPEVTNSPVAWASGDGNHHVGLFVKLTVNRFHISGCVETLRGATDDHTTILSYLVVIDHDDSLGLLEGALLLGQHHPPVPIPVEGKAERKNSGAENGQQCEEKSESVVLVSPNLKHTDQFQSRNQKESPAVRLLAHN